MGGGGLRFLRAGPLTGVVVILTLAVSCGPISQPGSTPRAAANSPAMRPLESCVQASDMAREVSFKSPNGEDVIGAVIGDGAVGVTLAHSAQSDLCEWLPYAKSLRDMGRRVLIFDFAFDPVGDVAGAASELRRQGVSKIVLVGSSMGGTASLVAATVVTPRVVGVASLSGPQQYSTMDALAASKQLTLPVLYMAGRTDQQRPYDFPADAKTMYAACPSTRKQLLILPGNDHGSDLLAGNAADQARSALEKFIADATA
ncbi:MAG: hypothetical protein E6J05_10840 [Chloroflexi bacterium]|nr:MAG: hypothetical protein E6J05_10840 [Chloroflexota bacterium]